MQQQPPAFINVPVSQMRAPAMQIPPQAVQNQAPSQLQMQQRFQAPMDPSNQLPPHEQVYAEPRLQGFFHKKSVPRLFGYCGGAVGFLNGSTGQDLT